MKPRPRPWEKVTPKDRREHAGFLAWFRQTLNPRITRAHVHIPAPRLHNDAYVLHSSNGSFLGFTLRSNATLCMVYQHTTGMTDVVLPDVGKLWRDGKISDREWNLHRKYHHTLTYNLLLWRANAPGLTQYLGANTDLRFTAKLTLALNYQPPDHETPKHNPDQPDIPGLQF